MIRSLGRKPTPRLAAELDDVELGRACRQLTGRGTARTLAASIVERLVDDTGRDWDRRDHRLVVEEIAARRASVAVGMSVHAPSCFPLATHGTDAQRERLLPQLLAGDLLGAYCLSETHADSDPAAMTSRARYFHRAGCAVDQDHLPALIDDLLEDTVQVC